MSSLTILRSPSARIRGAVTAVLSLQEDKAPICHHLGDYEVYAGPNQALNLNDGNFVAWAGTLLYRGDSNAAAAKTLATDLRTGQINESLLFGPLACFAWLDGEARLLSDWLGSLRLFRNADANTWSTSFLAGCAAQTPLHINFTGAWEYVLHGACFGTDTPIAEVTRLRPDAVHFLDTNTEQKRGLNLDPGPQPSKLSAAAKACLTSLDPVFDAVANHWGNAIDSALSGGYDSRLILAMLRARDVQPQLHVYGSANDADVQIALEIAAKEQLSLEHIDKRGYPAVEPVAEIVRRNYYRFDALPPDGIFDNGADLGTRLARMRDGRVLLNGGGGEIFRNFFYLPDRRYTAIDLTRSFYSQFSPKACVANFDLATHRAVLGEKMLRAIDAEHQQLTRREVEMSYPLFRCRYWMAGNSSVNAHLGQFLTPLVESAVLRTALDVPLDFKNDGKLQAEMIRLVDPSLASYPSDYGYPFDRRPPLGKRVQSWLNRQRPLWLREYAFGIKEQLRRPEAILGNWLQQYGECLEDPDLPLIRALVHPERLSDPAMLCRAASLEYLFQTNSLA